MEPPFLLTYHQSMCIPLTYSYRKVSILYHMETLTKYSVYPFCLASSEQNEKKNSPFNKPHFLLTCICYLKGVHLL